MALHDDIHGWLTTLLPWQQELFLRALSGAPLDVRARDEVLDVLLGDPEALASARSVRREDLPADLATGSTVELLSIEHVGGVNRLADGEQLRFVPSGLNVIYGSNGSGKSGWARIPKHAGRAHHEEAVLGDAYVDAANRKRPVAMIRWQLAGAERRLDLVLDEVAPSGLAGMCVFDAACGLRLLTADHEVDYVPLAVEAVRRLHRAHGEVAERLRERLTALQDPDLPLELFSDGTEVRRQLAALGPESDVEMLRRIARTADPERREIVAREVAAIESENVDLLARAAELDAERAETLAAALTGTLAHIGADAVNAARLEREAVKAAEAAADRLSTERFAEEPLSGAATEPWLVLWNAAKAFMREVHGQEFPADHDAALCPTCMQLIQPEARERLLRFEEWVRSDAERQLSRARAAVAARVERLPDINRLRSEHSAVLTAIADADKDIATAMDAWFADAERVTSAIRAGEDAAAVSRPPDIRTWAAARQERAVHYRSLQDPAREQALRTELAELRAREVLATQLTDIERRVERLRQAERIRRAQPQLDTMAVSNRLRTFAASFITRDLESALHAQLHALNFDDVEVIACRTSGREGRPRVGVKVKTKDNIALNKVLSEGEQRRLALAFFLAEVSVSTPYQGQPIVLDDPVCSIDHQGRRHIARALAQMARDRQVIVFTHELTFLHELQRAARAAQVGLHAQYVSKRHGHAGRVGPGLPWAGKTARQRARDLNQRQQVLAALHRRDPDSAEYEREAFEFCERLREAFERVLEDEVLGGVVTRGDPGVHPQQLRAVAWSEEICRLSDLGNAETSPWVHDRSRAANPTPPTPNELQEGLRVLADLRTAVAKVHENRRLAAAASTPTPGEADGASQHGGTVQQLPGSVGAA
jgi:hypothetical protein